MRLFVNPLTTIAAIAAQFRDTIAYWSDPWAPAHDLWNEATRPRDAAERLADAEAEEEVAEPDNGAFHEQIAPGSMKKALRLDVTGCGISGPSGTLLDGHLRAVIPDHWKLTDERLDRIEQLLQDIRDIRLGSAAPAHAPADAAAERPAPSSHHGAGHQLCSEIAPEARIRRSPVFPQFNQPNIEVGCDCEFPAIRSYLDNGHRPGCPLYRTQ